MNGRSSLFFIIAAMALLLLGVRGGVMPIGLLAIFIGGIGVAGLVTSASRKPDLPPGSNLLEERLQTLEKRLQLTEDELSASNRELSTLKEAREFDRQLLEGRARESLGEGTEGGGRG